MGCSSCGNKVAVMNAANMVSREYRVAPEQAQGPCEYTDEILQVWLDKLKWFKDKGHYTKHNVKGATVNKYLGIILTSMNVGNKCVYRNMLDGEIKVLITFITGLQNV